ncbi:probable disease resistance protein At5g63020 [Euphorbia lathyris]|uniref:probable disease resistance protein At5g63020 n=1 Tax=Euphorbia lathyris TaxID=212925 RepID=UPI0033141445
MDLKPTIEGLENKLEEVWNCLTADEVGVIGIWGMGGIGKTTLLTQLNSKCLGHFDFVIWLKVSQEVKLEDLEDEFVKQIGLSKEKKSNDKAALISQVLQKNKVLVLLDDLWNRVELKDIGIPQNNKCQVVFTTRSELVCRLMEAQRSIKVEPLEWEEAWRLFQDRVGFETFAAHPCISRIAKEIVRGCQGLPLALVTSAHAMSSKKTLQEWEHSAEILRKSASSRVFSILKLSYDRLPDQNMKSCLLYCALFPESFEIPKEELIDKWIGEVFLDDGIDQADPINKGYNIVQTLVDLSLLEDEGQEVRMHDVIRDMCLWIACEVEKEKESYFVQGGTRFRNELPREELRYAKRISLMQNAFVQRVTQVPGSPHLLTLLLSHNRGFGTIVDGFFRYMKALTVLDLSETGLRVLPTDISELVSLRYLDLSTSEIEKLPRGVMKLEKLQCLNLEYTPKLRKIPRQMIASLKMLQVFRIVGSHFILGEFSVGELERLENLKALSLTIKDAYIYRQVLNSQKLSSCIETLLVEDLEPPYGELVGTKTQTVYGINKVRCFDKLRKVRICCCHYLQDLTWVMRAPKLMELIVRWCENLQVISSYEGEENEKDLDPFARLEFLVLIGLPQLKSICWKPMLFPFLYDIRVCGCPMLKKLPLNTNSAKGCDLEIEGTTDWWFKLQWEDDPTRIAFRFCFAEIAWPYRTHGTNTSADRNRGIQHRVRCLLENLDRLAETRTMIGEAETRTMMGELVWNFSDSYMASRS